MKNDELHKVVVVIPSLDPDNNMLRFVSELVEVGFNKILIIDDGSNVSLKKEFDVAAEKYGCHVLRHTMNLGKGRALKTAFNYCLNTYTFKQIVGVVTADADGQHSAYDTAKVALRLLKDEGLVLGTRNFNTDNVPFKSRFGNKVTTLFFLLLFGKKILDTQTGLRGIPYTFLASCIILDGERFDYEINMLIYAVKTKIFIVETPIETIYFNSNRATHFSAVKDSFRIYKVMLRCFLSFCLSAIISFLIDISIFGVLIKIFSPHMEIPVTTLLSTVLSRGVSSLFNYSVNKNAVFKNCGTVRSTMLKYYSLCITELLTSCFFVTVIYSKIHFNVVFIKVFVDCLLFFISYQIQRHWVFKEEIK